MIVGAPVPLHKTLLFERITVYGWDEPIGRVFQVYHGTNLGTH